jgi:hypothetical protein
MGKNKRKYALIDGLVRDSSDLGDEITNESGSVEGYYNQSTKKQYDSEGNEVKKKVLAKLAKRPAARTMTGRKTVED